MAYDERLAQRIRAALQGRPHITEKKKFGRPIALLAGALRGLRRHVAAKEKRVMEQSYR